MRAPLLRSSCSLLVSATALCAAAAPTSSQVCEEPSLARVLDAGVPGPALWPESGAPVFGRDFDLRISNAPAGATGLLFVSLGSRPTVVAPSGATVYPASPWLNAPFLIGADGESAPFFSVGPLPVDLCGRELFVQAGLLGPLPTDELLITNGLHLRIGAPLDAPFRPTRVPLPDLDSLAAHDMDGDGIVDLLGRSGYFIPDPYDPLGPYQQFVVLRGQPDGTFVAGATTQTLAGMGEFLVEDFDGDGFLDVVTRNVLLLGDGAGGLTLTPGSLSPGANFPSLDLGDWNGDGLTDVIRTGFSGSSLILNLGAGVFSAPVDLLHSGERIAAGHFDGDGFLDAVASQYQAPALTLFLGDGTGALPAVSVLPTAGVVTALAVLDFEGDGADELVYGVAGDDRLFLRRGLGAGTFGPEESLPMPGPVRNLEVFDLDADGNGDLVANDGASVLLNRGDGTFEPADHYGFPTGSFLSNGNAFTDVDRDGSLDLLTAGGFLFRGRQGVLFDAPRRPVAGLTVDDARDVATGDLNGDGLDDVVVPDADADEILLLLAAEGGRLPSILHVPVPSSPSRVAVGDLNGDGALDIVVGHTLLGEVTVLLGDGAGGVLSQHPHPVGGPVAELVLANFDGSPGLDLAVAMLGTGGAFSVSLGNGDGTFGTAAPGSVGGDLMALVAGDFGGDGITDLALLRDQSGNHAVLLFAGNGDGTFGLQTTTFTTHTQSFVVGVHMTAADFEGDGDDDLVITARDGVNGYLLVWRSTGGGVFAKTSRFLRGAKQAAAADFSGDGVVDLLVASHGSSFGVDRGVHFLAGVGDGTFQQPGIIDFLGTRSGHLALGDFDRDGSPDAAIVNDLSEDLWVVLNRLGK